MPPKLNKPKAAKLRAVLDVLAVKTPKEVSNTIRALVFPNNDKIVSLVGEARDSLARARDLHAKSLAAAARGEGWVMPVHWNAMVPALNAASLRLHEAAQEASKAPHARMLKGNTRQFSKKALDFKVPSYNDNYWPIAHIGRLDRASRYLLDLAGIQEEDVERSRRQSGPTQHRLPLRGGKRTKRGRCKTRRCKTRRCKTRRTPRRTMPR